MNDHKCFQCQGLAILFVTLINSHADQTFHVCESCMDGIWKKYGSVPNVQFCFKKIEKKEVCRD